MINIRPLLPAGKYNVDKSMALLAASSNNKEVEVDDSCKRQLGFWELALLACNGRLSIPDPDSRLPPWTVDIHTDGAGSTPDKPGRGSGGVCGGEWFYIP